MQAQCGDSCLSRSKIYEWIESFKRGRISLCDDERSGSQETSTTEGCRRRGYSDERNDRQLSYHVEPSPALQRIQGRTSFTLYRSVVHYLPFSVGY
ncbi:hypothetical protein TNCV_3408711 [Trichonephila clavipes]|nr:hypothetical protein TNCV_3408711 [Trichonephila clavipes]